MAVAGRCLLLLSVGTRVAADSSEQCTREASEQSSAMIQQTARSYRLAQAQSLPSFASFVEEHGRQYHEGSQEYVHRRALFEERLNDTVRQNSKDSRLWTAGINHLSDWSEEELKSLFGWRGHAVHGSSAASAGLSLRQSGAVVSVESHVWDLEATLTSMDQGACGSCWAVAAAKMLEANHEIHTNETRSFSAQELVDCTPNPHECGGKGGCSGATVELAMLYTMNHGCSTSRDTPYQGMTGMCKNPPGQLSSLQGVENHQDVITMEELTSPGLKLAVSARARAIQLLNWERLPVNDDAALARSLLEGTVAVSVSGRSWAHYSRGIFDSCERDAVIDHAVLAVGFGVGKDDNKFWSILNSWGPHWGEQGRIRLLRMDKEYCGTDHQPELGTGCKGGPSSVAVCGMCGVLYDSVLARFGHMEEHKQEDDY